MGKNGNGRPVVPRGEARAASAVEVLRERLEGSGVEVVLERRSRERRRGSFGPTMDRRQTDRRRQRPVALLSKAAPPSWRMSAPCRPAADVPRRCAPRSAAVTQPCPTCASSIELEMPRFPHPPARVEMEVAHVAAGSRDAQHYVEIAAFTVSGRLILSQRVPGRRPV